MRNRVLNAAAALVCAAVMLCATATTNANALESPLVVDRATEAGINLGPTPTWDICKGDWNGDSSDDVAITRHMLYEGALFTQNSTGAFNRTLTGTIMPKVVRKTAPKHTGVDRHACVMADFDRNGRMDLYTTAGRYASNRLKHAEIDNELWMQQTDGTVVDMAIAAGVNEPCHRSRYTVTTDWNGDGWTDLFVGAQVERADTADVCNTMPGYPYLEQSHVYLNKGDSGDGVWDGFRQAPEFNVSAKNVGSAMAIEWDQNRDGRPDLLSLSFSDTKPLLFRNNAYSSFTEVSQTTGIKLPRMNYAAIGDVTGDGRDDLVYTDNAGLYYRAGTASGISTVVVRISTLASNADGKHVALGDVDGDGDVDVYGQTSGTTGNPDDVLYLNNGANATAASFMALPVPSAVGASNDVAAITVNGLTQFVVTNGGNEEKEEFGPVQLIALTSDTGGS